MKRKRKKKKYRIVSTLKSEIKDKKRSFNPFIRIKCCRPPPIDPIFHETDPRHQSQRLKRNQVQTSYESAEILATFPLCTRKSANGCLTILSDNRDLFDKVIKLITKLAKQMKMRAPEYAQSFFDSFSDRGKQIGLWPTTSIMNPFKVEDWSLASWMKLKVQGVGALPKVQGVVSASVLSTIENDDAQNFASFCYFIDNKSSLKHLNMYSIQCLSKILQLAVERATDLNETISDETDSDDSDGESSSSSLDSDDAAEEEEEEEEEVEEEEEEEDDDEEEGDEEEDAHAPIEAYKIKRLLVCKRAVRDVRIAFEDAMKISIKKYADREASNYRAKMRLHTFNNEQQWYQKSSKYSVKPSNAEFIRPWRKKQEVLQSSGKVKRDVKREEPD